MLIVKFSQFEEINAVEAQPHILETSSANETAFAPAPTEEITGNEIDVQGIEAQIMSQDFASGIMKILPDVNVSHQLKEWRNISTLVN